jgi:hypothetical protein
LRINFGVLLNKLGYFCISIECFFWHEKNVENIISPAPIVIAILSSLLMYNELACEITRCSALKSKMQFLEVMELTPCVFFQRMVLLYTNSWPYLCHDKSDAIDIAKNSCQFPDAGPTINDD